MNGICHYLNYYFLINEYSKYIIIIIIIIIQGICHYLNYHYPFFLFFGGAGPIVVFPNVTIDPGPIGLDLLRRFKALL